MTAQKRSETVNSIPIAVTALGADQLRAAGVTGIKDLTSTVPGLQIHTVGVDSFVGITIRGISNQSYSPSANPSVSTYIDGVYVDLPVGFAEGLYDISRVEVLRGPQGTLYGRSATGGNVNVVTADPEHQFNASVDASYGNYNDIQTHGMINLPVTDTLAVRAAFMQHRNDGYFKSGGTTARNYGAADDWGGRFTALWTPTSNFKWRLSVDQYVSKGTPGESIQSGDNDLPNNGLSPYNQPVGNDPEPENYIRSTSIRSRMEWKVAEPVTISYIAGYQHILAHYSWATTGQVGAPDNTGLQQRVRYGSSSEFQELNVSYDHGPLKNVMGASYFNETIPTYSSSGRYEVLDYMYASPYSKGVRKTSWGVFDQATLTLTDQLHLTGGIRYSHDRQSQSATTSYGCSISAYPDLSFAGVSGLNASTPGCYGASVTPGGSGSWSDVSYKAGVDYSIAPRTMVYASFTTGYKPGGVQPGLPAPIPSTFAPEHVTSYEAGIKTRLFDNKVNVRLAGFLESYRNLQVFQLAASANGYSLATLNAAKARIYGAEFETEWTPTSVDHFSGFINYLHATYLTYNNAIDSRYGTDIGSLAGNHLPNAPDWSFRGQYSHDFTLPNGGTLTPMAAVYYQTVSWTTPINDKAYRTKRYSKTNLNLTYADPTDHWTVAAYVDNLENKAVRSGDFSSSGEVYSDYMPPRTFGLRISYKYN